MTIEINKEKNISFIKQDTLLYWEHYSPFFYDAKPRENVHNSMCLVILNDNI